MNYKRVGPFPASIPPTYDGVYEVQVEKPASDDGLDPATKEVGFAQWTGQEFVTIDDAKHIDGVTQWWGQDMPPAGRMEDAVKALIETPVVESEDGL